LGPSTKRKKAEALFVAINDVGKEVHTEKN